MSEPRYNKNGIRILDDPKTNYMQNRRCMPGKHRWKESIFQTNSMGVQYECERCPEKYFEPVFEEEF